MGRRDWLERLSKVELMDQPFTISEHTIDRSWTLHGHEFYELELILSGGGTQVLNGVKSALQRGCLYLVTPADVHEIHYDPLAGLRLINLKFPEELIDEEVMNHLQSLVRPLCVRLEGDSLTRLESDIVRLQQEYADTRPCRSAAIRNTLNRLLIDMLREIPSDEGKGAWSTAMRDQLVMKRALLFIHQSYLDPIPLKLAAEHVHLSPNYFSERFHRWAGKPFQQYVIELRLNYADKLIRSSTIPITEIALSSGFNSLAYFIRAYKRYYAVTPNAARKLAVQSGDLCI